MHPRATFASLIRCAGSSLAAVVLEFGLLSLLVSVLHVFYLAGAALAGALHFGVNFLLNRHWVFRAAHRRAWPQLVRHGLVAGGGSLSCLTLLWAFVHGVHLPYQLGWAIAGTLAFLVWTYPLHQGYTYRQ